LEILQIIDLFGDSKPKKKKIQYKISTVVIILFFFYVEKVHSKETKQKKSFDQWDAIPCVPALYIYIGHLCQLYP
jgi:hypothetical protein